MRESTQENKTQIPLAARPSDRVKGEKIKRDGGFHRKTATWRYFKVFEFVVTPRFRGKPSSQQSSGYNVEEELENKESSDGFVEFLQLGLEEAFFLLHALNCLVIKSDKVVKKWE
jgi:hypothetical protein